MDSIKKLFNLLTPRERKHTAVLTGMILVMAFLDVLGVASILPFMLVLSNPDSVQTNAMLNAAFTLSSSVGIHSIKQFHFALGVMVFILLVCSLAFKALTMRAQIRFASFLEFSLGKRLMEGYLRQPYAWFLNRNSAVLSKNILAEVSAVCKSGVLLLLNLIAQTTVSLALLLLLMLVDPLLMLSITVVLVLSYAVIFVAVSGWLKRLGQARVKANLGRFKAISEAFGAIKDLKVYGLEQVYTQNFAKPAEIFARSQVTIEFIAQLPRFALEAVAFGGLLLLILFLMAKNGSFIDALPVLSLYAFAGYRLMPALQQTYQGLATLRSVGPAVNSVYEDVFNIKTVNEKHHGQITPLQFRKALALKRVTYSYSNATRPALNGIDLTIPVHKRVGFVGTTGSGKTTLADLIVGLLEPQEGKFCIDDQAITASNRRQWQSIVGYVPQQIYLTDDSLAANIAFGLNAEDVDHQAVERASKVANLHKFVVEELPDGYDTPVGERGVRLSGGQRQRIGIARALYHNPQVLVLDEATSALDIHTERAVVEAVNNLGRDVTIILIAHRLSTVRQCDQIYLFERGKIKDTGTFNELYENNSEFKSMVVSSSN